MKRLVLLLTTLVLAGMASDAIAELRQEVSIWVARDVAPGPKIRLTINTSNVAGVEMAAYRLSDAKSLLDRDNLGKEPPHGRAAMEWTVNMMSAKDSKSGAQRDVYRSRQVNLPQLPTGAYLLVARGGREDAWSVVNITNLSVVAKRSTTHLLTWVTNAVTGKVVEGAKVSLYRVTDRRNGGIKGKPIIVYSLATSDVTGSDGTSLITAAPGNSESIIVSHGTDFAVVPCGITRVEGVLKSHCQTDRPVYRPGQTAQFKVILRRTKGTGYVPVSGAECSVQIRDPEDSVMDETKTTTNAIGTICGHYDIPAEGAVGPYSIVVTVGKDSVYDTFAVAEYRKPDFKVTVTPEQKRYIAGEGVTFGVQAAYYFGAPLPQAEVRYKVRRSGLPYWYESEAQQWYSSDDGNLYARDTYGSADFIAEGTVFTDDKGLVSIPIKTKIDAPDSSYSVTCTVIDASKREVEGSASVPVYAAGIRVGLDTDVMSVPLGGNIPVKIKVVDLDRKPSAAKVTLSYGGDVWSKKDRTYHHMKFGSTVVEVPASGQVSAAVPAKTEGEYTITAEAADKLGHKTRSSVSVWVAGPNGRVEKETDNEPTVSIKLERQVYSAGDVVQAWISTNTLDRPILVTAEGYDVWKYAVLPAGKAARMWSIRTTAAMSPNIVLEAAQWTKSGMVSANTPVPIPDKSKKISVAITPEKQVYRPGETANYVVSTTGPGGKPVQAEVAVSVVDEAIYAIRPDSTPDLYLTFWSNRPNGVATTYSAPEEVSGGAYQSVSSVAPIRERFMDTAYWNGQVQTGADGTATISFETPANLTTWRTTARAITVDTKCGTGSTTTQASRPVMLRLSTPRQMVQGDTLQLTATVNNQTDVAHDFEVSVSATELRIDGGKVKKVRVESKSQATATWPIAADALPDDGLARVTSRVIASDATSATSDDLSDALKVSFKIVPKGISHRIAAGGSMQSEETARIELPADRIEPASTVKVVIRAGVSQVVKDLADETVREGHYGSVGAADELVGLAIVRPGNLKSELPEALAVVRKGLQGQNGWDWWTGEPLQPEDAATVLTELVRAKSAGLAVPQKVIEKAVAVAKDRQQSENLWERLALLSSTLTLAGSEDGPKLLQKVHDKGNHLSLYAKLTLAEAYVKAGHRDWAVSNLNEVLQNLVSGPEDAYLPVGDRAGWSASTVETTSQTLLLMSQMSSNEDVQTKLARWLANAEITQWLSQHEKASAAWALRAYAARHPESGELGKLTVDVNGTRVDSATEDGKTVQVSVPRSLLKTGKNTFVLRREGSGEVFYSIEAKVYVPVVQESLGGMRVLRRYEVQNSAGMWEDMGAAIPRVEPIRCTVMIWPGEKPDEIKLTEPIPAGFEFVDSDDTGCYSREEVRDGAVVHYLRADGNPTFFRYYLRAESEGTVTALPASAEAVRRPTIHGNSEQTTFEVSQ